MSSNDYFVTCTSNKHSAESEALGGEGEPGCVLMWNVQFSAFHSDFSLLSKWVTLELLNQIWTETSEVSSKSH